jgi:P-type E1-E2 ATPase
MIFFADEIRPDLPAFLQRLKTLGVRELVMLTGDHTVTARTVAAQAGITKVRAGMLPAGKVETVQALRRDFPDLMMVGDGINDAPALAAASVGVALGARGAAISAAAADVVLLVDDVTRVADAVEISHRTLAIIWQSIVVGLGLSAIAMVGAGLGIIPPVVGAAIQEGIDAAVILNALRAR